MPYFAQNFGKFEAFNQNLSNKYADKYDFYPKNSAIFLKKRRIFLKCVEYIICKTISKGFKPSVFALIRSFLSSNELVECGISERGGMCWIWDMLKFCKYTNNFLKRGLHLNGKFNVFLFVA